MIICILYQGDAEITVALAGEDEREIERERGTETHRQAERNIGRQRVKETNPNKYIHIYIKNAHVE